MWISLAQKECCRKKGTILINAFWILFILLLVVSAFAWRISLELKISKIFTSRLKALSSAKAGVYWAGYVKKNLDNSPAYDSLNDTWAGKENNDVFKDKEVEETIVNIRYLNHYDTEGNPVYYYGLIDEERKINLNTKDLNALRMFVVNLMDIINRGGQTILTSDIIEAIIDWRDKDEITPEGETENDYYGYINRNGEFKILEELLLLKGMDKEKFNILQKYFTIYGNGKININTAEEKVLSAIVSVFHSVPQIAPYLDRVVEEIIAFRPFSSAQGLFNLPVIREIVSTLPEEIKDALFSSLSVIIGDWITFTSTVFQVNIEAKTERVRKTVRTFFSSPEGKIIYWNEN
ncbi:MAG: type II secretion system protein GspK [Candidatus Omnitrophica bacterium]|nr:type II secretion system protein GspK [Candidatus Omnitrophota bacterium]